MNESVLKVKSFEFALRVVELYKFLVQEKKEFVMSKQLLRSETSFGANIRESQKAEGKLDFIHKLSIAQKECIETLYWLELLHQSDYLTTDQFISTNEAATELLRMFRSAILTTKQNLRNKS